MANGFVHANGLTINAERSKLWVNDPVRRSVSVYARKEEGDLSELPAEEVTLPHAVDNIHLDEQTGHMFAGSIPLLHQQLDHSKPNHGTFLDMIVSDEGSTFDTFADLITHDGTVLNQMSACYRVMSEDGKVWGVCGSPLGDGLLACAL